MQLQATGKLAVPRNYVKGGEKKNTERIAHPAFDLELESLQLLYDLNLNRKNGFVFFKEAQTCMYFNKTKKYKIINKSVWHMSLCVLASFTVHKGFK